MSQNGRRRLGFRIFTRDRSKLASARRRRQLARQVTRFRPRLEPLEPRRLLTVATDLASISGIVFDDISGDGLTAGEEIAGATVNLYRDANGNGIFEPGGGDTLVQTDTTDANGRYTMTNVTAGNYFVQQPAQTASGTSLNQQVSPLLAISGTAAEGVLIQTIDSFDMTTHEVNDSTNDGTAVASSVSAPETLGGERDIFVSKTSVNGTVTISVNDPNLPSILAFDSEQQGDGQWNVSWDGDDNNALVIDDTGLGGVDLTSGDTAEGFRLQIGADNAGGTATIRVYTNDNVGGTTSRSSESLLTIPDTGGAATSTEYIPFSVFTGSADFTSVDAIEMQIDGFPNINGTAELVGTIGPTEFPQNNFDNFDEADLSLTKVSNTPAPAVGQNVSFTVTVLNGGPDAATGITVTDQLPAGIDFLSATPSQGNYNSATGLWTVGAISGGGTATLQLTGRLTSSGPVTNLAQITTSDQADPDSTPGNNNVAEDDQASVTVMPEIIDLSLTKSVSDATPNAGQQIAFVITVSNAGPSTATGVNVADALPSGLTFVSAIPSQGSYDNVGGIWNVGSILGGGSATLTLNATVDSAGSATNTAQVTSADQADVDSIVNNNEPGEDDQASVTVVTTIADLSVAKVADTLTPNVNQNVTYTITISNAGPDAASGVELTDQLPTGIIFVQASPSIGTYNSSTGIWNVGPIGSGASQTLTLVGRVESLGAKTNVAEITASDQFDSDSMPGNGSPVEDDRAAVTVIPPTADLSLTKTVNDATPNVGENVVFTLSVRNSGPDAATGVQVRDQLPVGTTFVTSDASQGAYDNGTGVWTVGTIPNGVTATLRITATAGTLGLATNAAEILASDQLDPDSTPDNNVPDEDDIAEATFTPEIVDLSIDKTVDNDRPNNGDNVTFTVTVSNGGPNTATNIQVRDTLPAGLTFISGAPNQGTFNSSQRIWTIPSISNGGSATLSLVARVDGPGALTNVAEVIAVDQPDIDSTPDNNEPTEDDQAASSVTARLADISLTKSIDNPTPNVGDNVIFTIDVSNSGPDGATGVSILDALPAGLTFVSASPTVGSYNSSSGVWALGTLTENTSTQMQLVARVDSNDVKTNTAQVSASDQSDPDSTPGNNRDVEDDQDSIIVTPQSSDLSLTKTVDESGPNVGTNVTYRVSLRNDGPDTATNVQITDTLPLGVSFVSASPSQGAYDEFSGIWRIPAVTSGATETLDIVVVVDDPGVKTNTAEVTAVDQFDRDSTPDNGLGSEDDQATVDMTPLSADLSLTKTVDNPAPNVGENATYTITVRNDGPDNATGVQVREQLPASVTLVSATPSAGTFNSGTGIWDLGAINNRRTATLQLVATGTSVGDQENVAEIVASDTRDPDSTPGNNLPAEDDQATATISPQQIDLSLQKTVDNAAPNVGETVTYTITVRNEGPSDATGVRVSDPLSAGLSIVSANPSQGSYAGGTGLWTAGDILAGGTASIDVIARVDSNGTIVDSAEISAADQPDVDSTPGNNVATEDDQDEVSIITPVADLSLTQTVSDGTPLVVDDVIFTVRVTNDGPDQATEIVVLNTFPPGLLLTSAMESQGTFDQIAGLWTVGGIPSGGSATLMLNSRVISADPSTNTAEIQSVAQFDPDSDAGNSVPTEDDQASVQVAPQLADLSVTASVDNESPELGDSVVTTFTVTNAGPEIATGVTLSAPLPGGFTFVNSVATQGNYDASTGIWTLGTLNVGETRTLVITERVDAFGIRPHTIEVQSSDQFDPDSTPGNLSLVEDDLASVVIQAPRGLSIRLFLSR